MIDGSSREEPGGTPPPGSSRGAPFPAAFYDREPGQVARDLLGAVLECLTPAGLASGRIVETEAYLGPHDPACHAVAGRTRRTWHLHGPPGVAYVYRIYGLHWCFNAVTLPEGVGSAVLVRAIEPLAGIALMRRRRGRAGAAARSDAAGGPTDRDLTNGPGKLCQALGIDGTLDGGSLDTGPIVLRPGDPVADAAVDVTPRIGITRAADWPLRYLVRASSFVSRTPPGFPRLPYPAPDPAL